VGNLAYSINKGQLEELFSKHGQVQSVTVMDGKGFGFVEMSSSSEAEAAKDALNGTDLQGRTLKVDEARPPKKRGHRDGGGFRQGGGRNFRRPY